MPTVPINPQGYEPISVNPLYLGFSDYFKKYIAVTIHANLFVYSLSDNMVHWGPLRTLMQNPTCGSNVDCPDALFAYPSIMDPAYLSRSNDSTTASNGITGMKPLVTYIKNVHNNTVRQQFATQQITFEHVPVNRMDNISARGLVTRVPGGSMTMGFVLQGTEEKRIVFRGLRPYRDEWGDIKRPSLSLYRDGNLIARNAGWTALSDDDKTWLHQTRLVPDSDTEAAIVFRLHPGSYTLELSEVYERPWWCSSCVEEGGRALIEMYDTWTHHEAKIANVSLRGQSVDGSLALGFISRGGQRAVVRGTSHSTVGAWGYWPVIDDPWLTAYDGGSVIADNNNWNESPNAAEVIHYGLQPGDGRESAFAFSTQGTPLPGDPHKRNYTVHLWGNGFGFIELYNVNP